MQVHWSAAEGSFVYSLGNLSLCQRVDVEGMKDWVVVGRGQARIWNVPPGVCSDGNTESHRRQSTEETVQNTPPHASKNS